MSIRMVLLLFFLSVGPVGCSNYMGYEDSEFGQNFADAVENPLNSEKAKSLSAEGRELIALMDRVSKEYATCWAYFSVASGNSKYFGTGQSEESDALRLYKRNDRIAAELTLIATRVGRDSDMARSVAFRRQNHNVRLITGYYDDTNPSWEQIHDEFDDRCNSATQDVAGTITGALLQEE